MRIIFYFTLFLLVSCGYPDIDSVPSFKELKLNEEELFDLCQLNSADKSEFDNCIKESELTNE